MGWPALVFSFIADPSNAQRNFGQRPASSHRSAKASRRRDACCYAALVLRWVALVFACWLGCVAARAQSQPLPRPALHWARGAGATECVEPHALAQLVEALTGPVLVRPSEADNSV